MTCPYLKIRRHARNVWISRFAWRIRKASHSGPLSLWPAGSKQWLPAHGVHSPLTAACLPRSRSSLAPCVTCPFSLDRVASQHYASSHCTRSESALCAHMPPLFWISLPSNLPQQTSAIHSRFSSCIHFIHSRVYMSIPVSQFIPPPLLLRVHIFVLYACVSISALQVSSSLPFFSRFQICTVMDDISLSVSDLFHSVWESSGSIYIS